MTPAPSRSPLAPLGVLVSFAAVLVAAVGTGRGQPPAAAGRADGGAEGLNRRFITAKDCARCHRPASPGAEPLFAGDPAVPKLVRFDESIIWSEADKHSRAYDALTGPRGQVMGRLLGYKDVKTELACLSCHSTGFLPADTEEVRAEAIKSVDQGVNCSACHGPYLNWVENHGLTADQSRRWRQKTVEEKSEKFGMTDLRDPARRADVCSSCHVGKAAEGKVVTHAMYAAGHPPLPAFEVASFLETMPTHWDKPGDVAAFQKDQGLRARCHIDFSEPQATRAAVIGGVVALGDAMRLLAATAEPDPAPLPRSGKNWPDYAQFECYACHHDLKIPAPDRGRQARGFAHRFDGKEVPGVPGRPQFRPWPLALARLALARDSKDREVRRDAYRRAVEELYAAFDARPFGDPERVSRAAKGLADWSDDLLKSLRSTPFDKKSIPHLLAALAATPAAEVADVDSARQVAWAFREIYSDLEPKPRTNGEVVKILGELDRSLKLDPYASREKRTRVLSSGALKGKDLLTELSRLNDEEFRSAIESAAGFDPDAFHETLERLGSLLPEGPPGH